MRASVASSSNRHNRGSGCGAATGRTRVALWCNGSPGRLDAWRTASSASNWMILVRGDGGGTVFLCRFGTGVSLGDLGWDWACRGAAADDCVSIAALDTWVTGGVDNCGLLVPIVGPWAAIAIGCILLCEGPCPVLPPLLVDGRFSPRWMYRDWSPVIREKGKLIKGWEESLAKILTSGERMSITRRFWVSWKYEVKIEVWENVLWIAIRCLAGRWCQLAFS